MYYISYAIQSWTTAVYAKNFIEKKTQHNSFHQSEARFIYSNG